MRSLTLHDLRKPNLIMEIRILITRTMVTYVRAVLTSSALEFTMVFISDLANLTVKHQYHYGTGLLTSPLAHPVPTILSGSVFKTSNDYTYEV